ncbi:MAG: hypothetical protein ABS87_02465 [Sphingomonas sp. SCN 67-18]|uniref:hypothetical protein n=1 Tax=uncultured Sphingomonas sp. TaxID=158754 RepID=UPI00086E1BCE|nr:hypothetical protein [Sphingomonas sp. SCN 67-18]ODU22233.1 MAG: hypothetical protein ABS87_02465 [Sphingomonas sp. SCN 67-18]
MDRTESTGLAVAITGHVVLFGLLSVGFLATPNPSRLQSDPVEVQFVDEIGLKSAFPEPATEDPAESVAPELGVPDDAAPPEAVQPDPAPAPPKPEPAPPPKPAAKAPPKPEPPRPAPKAEASKAKSKSSGSAAAATDKPQRGSRLGADFRKGLAAQATSARGQTPRASAIGAQAMSGLASALFRQFKPCYELGSMAGTEAMSINTVLRLRYRKDGSVAVAPEVVEQTGVTGGNSSYARQMAEIARRAVLRCSPVSLPAELYEGGWDDFELRFIPGQLS